MKVSAGADGATLPAVPGLPDWSIDLLPCYHPCETVGFGFKKRKRKMKAEFLNLDGTAKKELRERGVSLTEDVFEHHLAFFGDTHIGALKDHHAWKQYPIVIIECTHYDETGKSPESVRAQGHIHWQDLFPVIKENPDNFFVLIHSSQAMGR